MAVMCPRANLGPTGHCQAGRHSGCSYSPGGACERGVWVPECYVTLPPKGGRKGDLYQGKFLDGIAAVLPRIGPLAVVHPSHVVMCGCACHAEQSRVGQLELFEVVA